MPSPYDPGFLRDIEALSRNLLERWDLVEAIGRRRLARPHPRLPVSDLPDAKDQS
jgi:hypothetical protein